ncbi:MAG: hypothetical protein EOO73_15840 [Myxococcales bacterium]|nr:MAG: hypothetical protein EOO73_15840 [Myxococcales bacterium]
MSNAAVVQDETEDRYYTQVEAGDVRLFTLDQLDAAFNAGLIHENTYVCLEGESEWLTLAEVAGLGDEEEEAAPVSAPQLIAHPAAHAPAPYAQSFAAQPFGVAASPSIVPSAPSVAPYSVAPMVMTPSIRPVVNDLAFDDDLDMMAMRPKRRMGKVVAGLAVLALGGLGFAVVQSGGIRLPKLGDDAAKASAASMSLSSMKQAEAPKPVVAPTPEPAKPEPPKEEAKPAEASADSSDTEKAKKSEDDRFSEEMKAALLNKDKKQAATSKQKKTARGAVAAKSKGGGKAAKAGGGFKAGGSAYDPLNGKL